MDLIKCKQCDSTSLCVRQEGPHTALRCQKCDAWQQWVSSKDIYKVRTQLTEQTRFMRISALARNGYEIDVVEPNDEWFELYLREDQTSLNGHAKPLTITFDKVNSIVRLPNCVLTLELAKAIVEVMEKEFKQQGE